MIALAGLLLAWLAIFSGVFVAGGQLGSLSNFPAALVVLGGTLAAGMIQLNSESWQLAWRLFPQVFWPDRIDLDQTVVKLTRWCQIARRDGPLALDTESDKEPDSYLRLGLQTIVDGQNSENLIKNLTIATDARENQWFRAAELFAVLASYAPSMGIIAAVLGVIQILTQTASTEAVASGAAMALVACIYGVALAHLCFQPIAGRLRSKAMLRSQFEAMVVDGMVAIVEGENPRVMERRLREYRQ